MAKLIATAQVTLDDGGAVRMVLNEVKPFDSGVVPLTYLPAS